jgi:hypothetical protein
MEIAKLVLEFLKVLLWPIVTLIIVIMFKPHVERLLLQLSNRVGSAETLKLGLMGQEVQISGTAKELAKERALLAQSADPQGSGPQIEAIDQATRELNSPMADVIGIGLMHAAGPIRIENILREMVRAIDPKQNVADAPPMVILSMTREVEKVLGNLQKLGFATAKDEAYELTESGRRFFRRVADHQSDLLARFKALK